MVLNRIKQLNIRQRGFITALYGLENDSFVADDLRIYNMEQQLHLYLREEGYQTIVFYSSTDGFYAYEQECLARFMNISVQSRPSQPVRLFDPAKSKRPLGGRKLVKENARQSNKSVSYEEFIYCPDMSRGFYTRKGRMAYDAIVSKLLSVLDNQKEVVVIMHVTMSETELPEALVRQLEERLRRILDNYHATGNTNKLLVNYHLAIDPKGFVHAFGNLYRSIFTTPFFRHLFIVDTDGPVCTDQVFFIGTPDSHEIRNYINRLRLVEEKVVVCEDLDEICNQLADRNYTIVPVSLAQDKRQNLKRSLKEILDPLPLISFDVLKEKRYVMLPYIEVNVSLMRKELGSVKGQQDMTNLIITDIQRWAEQPRRERPLSFFAVGTSGVGKTYTTECLATSLRDAGFDYLRFNMTEFSQEHEGAKLIGSPPGYVGSTTRPKLFEALRTNKRLIVCFDEIEKAHDTVITLLMNLLDAGSLSWNDETGDFTDCILFFTSNLMQEEVVKAKQELADELDLSPDELAQNLTLQNRIRDIFKNPTHSKRLRPEFCGRIDRYLVYDPLNASDVITIAIQNLKKLCGDKQIAKCGISPEFLFEITKTYANSMYGVRGMKQMIQEALKSNRTPFPLGTIGEMNETDTAHKALSLYQEYMEKPKIQLDEARLHKELEVVKGQEEVIEVLIKDLKAWSLIPKHNQPLNFFAVGTSGVGKTFTAECLANALKKDGYRSVVFSMTEYSRESDVAKLIGSAPGYAGANERPELFRQIAECPRLVICFDEIEKAHPLIMRTLMQLLDKGRLSWNGEIGDFKDCIILFTSNLEQQKMVETKNTVLKLYSSSVEALRSNRMKQRIAEICSSSKIFQVPVEVWGRINRYLVYNPLKEEAVIEVAIQESCGFIKKVYGWNLLHITPDFLAELAEQCANSPLGMRPLKDEIRSRMIEAASSGATMDGKQCQLLMEQGNYVLQKAAVGQLPDWEKIKEEALALCQSWKYAVRPFDKSSLISKLQKVYCQEDKAVLLASKIAVWFMKPQKRAPLTLFLAGTSGTGKTYTSRIIASFLSDYGYEYTDINMAEYGNEGDVWKLIGSATGYMGSDKKPLLRQAYDRSSKQVILFDEIEKAHLKILDAIMRLMERGLITLNDRECDFSQCILLFTSNVAMDRLVARKHQLEEEGVSCEDPVYQQAMKQIMATAGFRPDILGRINTVAIYNPLDEKGLRQVALSEIRKLGESYNLQITNVSSSLLQQIAHLFVGNNEGARPVCNYCEMLFGELFALSPIRQGQLDLIEKNGQYLLEKTIFNT